MKYELTFYIQSDKDATIDKITVEADSVEGAIKQVRKEVLGRPKFVSIKEVKTN